MIRKTLKGCFVFFLGGGSSLEPGRISGKNILKVIGQLSGPLQKVLGVLKCGNSMLASKAHTCVCAPAIHYMNSQCELSYFHCVKLFCGIFKVSRKLNSAKLKTFDNWEVPVQPWQLLFDLAMVLGGGCICSGSVSKDKCIFFKSGRRGWKRSIHLGTSSVEWSSEYKRV